MVRLMKRMVSAPFLLFLLAGLAFGLSISRVTQLPNRYFIVFLLSIALPFVAVLFGDIRRFLMVALIVSIPLRIDINFKRIFENQAGASSLGISLSDVFLIVLLFIWILELATREDVPRPRLYPRLTVPALLFFEVSLLSLCWAPRLDLATLEIVQMFKVLLLYFVFANHIRSRADLKLALWALAGTLAAESVLGLAQAASGQTFSLGFLGEARNIAEEGKLFRVGGTLGHPNRLAMFIEFLLPLTMSLFLFERARARRILAVVIFGAAFLALILTGSRGGWIGFLASMVIYFAALIRRRTIRARVLIGPALLTVLIVLSSAMSSDIINRRVRGEDYGSAMSRIPMIQIALNLIEAHPVGGVGLNNYAVVMGEFDNTILGRRYKSIHRPVHNTYLLIAGETGILGLASFLLLVFSAAAVLLRAMRSDDALHYLFALALVCGFLAFFLHGLVDKHSPGGNPLFYLLLSLCAALSDPSALRLKGETRC